MALVKIGIVSHSKLLTVFIRENMTRGLFNESGGIKVTHGKLWGHLICLFENEGNELLDKERLAALLMEYKIGQLLSLGVADTPLPVLDDGDIVISSEAAYWEPGQYGKVIRKREFEANPKLLDRVLTAFERYQTDEVGSRAVVGAVNSLGISCSKDKDVLPNESEIIQCWDRDGYHLAELCEGAGIPWSLVRFILNGEAELDKVSPVLKWDLAKKCFWIVKGVLESTNRPKINKRAR